MGLEHISQLCTFENSTECSKISFDSDSFQNSLTGQLAAASIFLNCPKTIKSHHSVLYRF